MESVVNIRLSHAWAQQELPAPASFWERAISAFLQVAHSSSVYVEGWAVNATGLLFEHAWIEVDGEIIDPSLYGYAIQHYVGGPYWSLREVQQLEAEGRFLLPAVYNLETRTEDHLLRYESAFARALQLSDSIKTSAGEQINFEQVKALAMKKQASGSGVSPSAARIEALCERAARRILVRLPHLDTLRAQATIDRNAERLMIEITLGIHAKGGLQTIPMQVPYALLTASDEEVILTLETLLADSVEQYLGNR